MHSCGDALYYTDAFEFSKDRVVQKADILFPLVVYIVLYIYTVIALYLFCFVNHWFQGQELNNKQT